MKVIQINSECGRGSTGRIASAISRKLDEKGCKNYILYSANHRSDDPHGIMIGTKLMLRVHQLLARIFGDTGFHSYFATQKLIRTIRDIDPDLILLHNLHGYYLHIGVLFRFLKEYDKPVLWTLHDCWAFTGHCTHYQIARCYRWQSGCRDCPNRKEYPYSWFFDRSRSLYRKKKELFASVEKLRIIVPSKWLSDEVEKSFLSDKPRYVIHNGIDLNVFVPTETDFRKKHRLENKIMVLGVAAVWNYGKGLDIIIELANRMDPQRYAFILVGTDDSVDKSLPKSIISIHRTQNQKELAEIYSAADVLINPTRQDNYPTVNMEALACGTPVITFDTGGCSESGIDGFTRVITSKNTDELEKALLQVSFKTQEESAKCSAEAKRFDERSCFARYVTIFEEIVEKNGEISC